MVRPIEELRANRTFQNQDRDPVERATEGAERLNFTLISLSSKLWGYLETFDRKESFQANKLQSFSSVTAQFQEVTELEMMFMAGIVDKFGFSDRLLNNFLETVIRQPSARVIVNSFRFELDKKTGEAVLALPFSENPTNQELRAIIRDWVGPQRSIVVPEGRFRRGQLDTPSFQELGSIWTVLRLSEKAVLAEEIGKVNRELGQDEVAKDFEDQAAAFRAGRSDLIQESVLTEAELAPLIAAVERTARELIQPAIPERTRAEAQRLFGVSPEGLVIIGEIAPLATLFNQERGITVRFAKDIVALWNVAIDRLFEPNVVLEQTTAFREGRIEARRSNTFQLSRLGIISANKRRAAAKQRIANETLAKGVEEAQPLTVSFVPDGDTFDLNFGQTVRLLGVDAPERSTPEGQAAQDFIEEFTQGKSIRLEFDPKVGDRLVFGRLVPWVFVVDPETGAETFLQAEMVRRGFATVSPEGVNRVAVARRDLSITFESLNPERTEELVEAQEQRAAEGEFELELQPVTLPPIVVESQTETILDLERIEAELPDEFDDLKKIALGQQRSSVLGRIAAIRKIGPFNTREAAEVLIDVLNEGGNRPFVEAAQIALAKMQGEGKEFQLAAFEKLRGKQQVIKLVEVMARARRFDAIPLLRRILLSSNGDFQLAAAKALGDLGARTATDELISRASKGNDFVQATAARALGKIEDFKALPTLRNLAKKNQPAIVRAAALEAIGMLSKKELIAQKDAAIADKSATVKIGILEAATQTNDMALGAEIADALLRDKDTNVQRVAIRSLARIGGDDAARALDRFVVEKIAEENEISEKRKVRVINPSRVMAQIARDQLQGRVTALDTGVSFGDLPFVGGTIYIDGSGSMGEPSDEVEGKTKFQVAIDQAIELIGQLNKTMPINIAIANTKAADPKNILVFRKGAVAATPANKKAAIRFLDTARRKVEQALPSGRGDYLTAIELAIGDRNSPAIIMLGDFSPTDGLLIENQDILDRIEELSRFSPTMIFTTTITGSGVNERLAFDLATQTIGQTTAQEPRRRRRSPTILPPIVAEEIVADDRRLVEVVNDAFERMSSIREKLENVRELEASGRSDDAEAVRQTLPEVETNFSADISEIRQRVELLRSEAREGGVFDEVSDDLNKIVAAGNAIENALAQIKASLEAGEVVERRQALVTGAGAHVLVAEASIGNVERRLIVVIPASPPLEEAQVGPVPFPKDLKATPDEREQRIFGPGDFEEFGGRSGGDASLILGDGFKIKLTETGGIEVVIDAVGNRFDPGAFLFGPEAPAPLNPKEDIKLFVDRMATDQEDGFVDRLFEAFLGDDLVEARRVISESGIILTPVLRDVERQLGVEGVATVMGIEEETNLLLNSLRGDRAALTNLFAFLKKGEEEGQSSKETVLGQMLPDLEKGLLRLSAAIPPSPEPEEAPTPAPDPEPEELPIPEPPQPPPAPTPEGVAPRLESLLRQRVSDIEGPRR